MFAAKQMYSSQDTSFGNSNITGSGTTASPATVFANTVSTSTYLTYQVPIQTTVGSGAVAIPVYTQTYGNLTVSGNTAVLDILVVGAGGSSPVGNYNRGADGGQVRFYSNVIVPVGTYNLTVSGGYNSLGYSNIIIGTTTITATDGTSYSSTGTATGGAGAGGAQSSGVGGIGQNITAFGTDLTWITGNGNPYFGPGGGGSATNTQYAGGITFGGSGIYNPSYSPTNSSIQAGFKNTGAGSGAGNSNGTYELNYFNYYGGTGVIIIRHRAS
jgi:hypothetical protein